MRNENRVAVFIDGPNFYSTMKALGVEADYKKIHKLYQAEGLLRISYYTATLEGGDYNSLRPMLDWLDYNGYRVVTKPAKEYHDRATGARKVKGNLDIEIAVDALEAVEKTKNIVLFTGDGDFTYLVQALQRKGAHVTIVSTIKTSPPMIADDLRRQADTFVDVLDLAERIGRSDPDRTRDRRPVA